MHIFDRLQCRHCVARNRVVHLNIQKLFVLNLSLSLSQYSSSKPNSTYRTERVFVISEMFFYLCHLFRLTFTRPVYYFLNDSYVNRSRLSCLMLIGSYLFVLSEQEKMRRNLVAGYLVPLISKMKIALYEIFIRERQYPYPATANKLLVQVAGRWSQFCAP